ncbi:MAG: hypothetical protein KBA51_02105 [Kiritimatiellae bacterium]|nr:hypothetical protein [Kiritimatiellia bacterium]
METKEMNPEVIAEFQRRRRRQLIAVVPIMGALFPLFMLDHAGPDGLFGIPTAVLGPVCIAIMIAGVVFSLINWRCPACKSYLGKAMHPRFCQKCGAQLQE